MPRCINFANYLIRESSFVPNLLFTTLDTVIRRFRIWLWWSSISLSTSLVHPFHVPASSRNFASTIPIPCGDDCISCWTRSNLNAGYAIAAFHRAIDGGYVVLCNVAYVTLSQSSFVHTFYKYTLYEKDVCVFNFKQEINERA